MSISAAALTTKREDSMALTMTSDVVARDLLNALLDEQLCDVSLVGADGILVPAHRFVLAARCRVFKRMLYGSFREAKSSTVYLLAYESAVLRAVVEFCVSHSVQRFAALLTPTEGSVRQIVQLVQAADYLELLDLEKQARDLAVCAMAEHPPLACAVWDEALPGTELYGVAQQMIECRPYVTLDIMTGNASEEARGGGVECIRASRIADLFANRNLAAGELFLLQMLGRWFQRAAVISSRDDARQVAQQCAQSIQLEDIEPRELLHPQMKFCDLISQERIFAAVGKQALRASQNRVWTLQCRGKPTMDERVLVEGAGTRDANGIYYRIPGLTTGDLYTKREVACGQQNVYTLSRTISKNSTFIECRIFCSQLLTYNAVPVLQHMTTSMANVRDSTFRPVLQIHSLHMKNEDFAERCPWMTLSDGRWYMRGTFAESLREQIQLGKIGLNSVVKVLDFGLNHDKGLCTTIHVRKIRVISASPGQRFGSPQDIQLVSKNKDRSDFLRWMVTSLTEPDDKNGLKSLYSCKLNREEVKVPSHGWQVEGHGSLPSPQCTWIPAVPSTMSSSRCSTSSLKDCLIEENNAMFFEEIPTNANRISI